MTIIIIFLTLTIFILTKVKIKNILFGLFMIIGFCMFFLISENLDIFNAFVITKTINRIYQIKDFRPSKAYPKITNEMFALLKNKYGLNHFMRWLKLPIQNYLIIIEKFIRNVKLIINQIILNNHINRFDNFFCINN